MKKTSENTISEIVRLHQTGESISNISAKIKISKSTVKKYLSLRVGRYRKNERGAPSKLSDRSKRLITRHVKKGDPETAVEMADELRQYFSIAVNEHTVRRAFEAKGLHAKHKIKKPLLRDSHVQKRMKFVKLHNEWQREDWRKVIFSDETKINIFGSDGLQWSWRESKELIKKHHVKSIVKNPGGSIFLWGCITRDGPGYLTRIDGGLNSELYIQILEDEFLNTLDYYKLEKDDVIFQHDNDPKHTAKKTKKWLQRNNIKVLEWPPNSPDMNPIEHIWALLKKKLSNYDKPPRNNDELWDRIQSCWNTISKNDCEKVIDSMVERIKILKTNKGSYTKY